MQFYTSLPASPQLAELAQTLGRKGRQVTLLPLAELPPARPLRLGPLRIEHGELLQSLAFTNWSLVLLANGTWQPDILLEKALRADKVTLETRLRVVAPLLQAEEAGPPPAA